MISSHGEKIKMTKERKNEFWFCEGENEQRRQEPSSDKLCETKKKTEKQLAEVHE